MRIWEKAGDYDVDKGSPIAWMATIARNRALDEIRRVRPVSLEDMPEGFEPAAEEVDPLGARDRSDRLVGADELFADARRGKARRHPARLLPGFHPRGARPSECSGLCRRSRLGCGEASLSCGIASGHEPLARGRFFRRRICARHARSRRARDAIAARRQREPELDEAASEPGRSAFPRSPRPRGRSSRRATIWPRSKRAFAGAPPAARANETCRVAASRVARWRAAAVADSGSVACSRSVRRPRGDARDRAA